jgi:hypothetical protein
LKNWLHFVGKVIKVVVVVNDLVELVDSFFVWNEDGGVLKR